MEAGSVSLKNPSLDSLMAVWSSDLPNQTSAGGPGDYRGRDLESIAVAPFAEDWGPVLVLEKETWWKYWTLSHKRAIYAA